VGEGAVPRPAALPLDLPEICRRLRCDDGPVEGASGNSRDVVPHFGFPGGTGRDIRRRTEKYLFRLEDGEAVESVLIPDEGRRTLCISSQVGCPLLCGFCATGEAGFRRNMTSAEIVQQVCFAAKRLAERGDRLSNVVFMGMGEPLLNVPDVSRTIGILLSQFAFGISGKRVTVSTAGSFRRCCRSR